MSSFPSSMLLASVRNLEEPIYQCKVIFKRANTLKSMLMHPRDNIPSQLKQTIVYKWSCLEEDCNFSYTA